METCSQAVGVADVALEAGHEVRVVPATLVRSLGVGARRTKTDRRDARILSEVSCRIDLPSVHIPTPQSRERKAMCSMHDALVRSRTQISNCVRGWLRTQGVRLPSGSLPTFAARVRAQLSTVPPHVARQRAMVEALTHAITAAERDLARQAKADSTCRRLMTAPGVGPQHGLRFVAALDAIGRFPTAHKVEPYLGLVPRRALELGEAAADWHHEGRLTGVAPHAGPGGLGGATLPTHGPAATLGPRGAEAAGQARRRGCPGPQAGGHPVRALARRDHLRTRAAARDDVAAFGYDATASVRRPQAVIAKIPVGLRPRNADCDPPTLCNLCATEREYSIATARRSTSYTERLMHRRNGWNCS
jgi:hypothetical protein